MRFAAYPEYIAPRIPWLRAIPAHWDVISVKHGYYIQLGKMLQPEKSDSNETYEPYIRAANVFWEGINYHDLNRMWMNPEDRNKYVIRDGDLVVSEGGDVGRSALVSELPDKPIFFQNALNRVRAGRGFSNKFLYYWLWGLKKTGYIDIVCGKATIPHLTAERLGSIECVVPSEYEQQKIAQFLDHETAKIDRLIAKQEKLAELLNEKQQAMISNAVTKGLNPTAPLKTSGSDWIGEIPRHWTIAPIKWKSFLVTGMTPSTHDEDNFEEQSEFPWIRPEDLDETGNPVSPTYYLSEKGWKLSKIVPPGSTLVCGIGSVGNVGYIDRKVATNQQITSIIPTIHTKFTFYALRAAKEKIQLETMGNVVNILNASRLGSIAIPIPTYQEQDEIARFLDRQTAKIDNLIKKRLRLRRMLQERKQALISAAVTGQIDVRDWEPPVAEEEVDEEQPEAAHG